MIKINLKEDLQQFILATLPYKQNPSLIKELQNKDISDLTIIFHNWISRLISAKPRRVHQSREFLEDYKRQRHIKAVNQIIEDIKNGKPLTERLSLQIVRDGYVPNNYKKRPDLDLMLNSWGVHHLHLGLTPEPKDSRFIKRTGDLLFIIFKENDAYLINIYAHGRWTDRTIVEIAVRNWPKANLFLEAIGVLPQDPEVSEKEHQVLRNSGINVSMQIDGRVYFPGLGLTSACTGINATRDANIMLHQLDEFERLCTNQPQSVERLFQDNNRPWPENPHFHLHFPDGGGYGVIEVQSKTFIPLS